MDFGIARVSGSEHLTNAGFMMGTPAYMAPEQVRGGDVDARADLYAMGVVFYRLTTGKLPFKGDTAFAMVQSQVNEPPTPIATIRADLPPWVDEIVTRALEKAPEQRFQSAAEFHEALARCMAGLAISTMYTTAGETMMTPSRMTAGLASGAIPSRAMPTPSAAYPRPSGNTAAQQVPENASASGVQPVLAGEADMTVAAPSGANARPPEPAAPPPAKAAPAGPAAAKKPLPMMWIGVAAVVVVGILVAYFAMRGRGTSEQAPVSSSAKAEPAAVPPVSDTFNSTAGTPTPNPTGVATTPAPPGATPAPGAALGTSPTAGPGRAATATGTPVAGRGPATTPTPTTAPTPAAAGADSPEAFGDMKFYATTGKRDVRDAVMHFGNGTLAITVKGNNLSLASLAYKRITRATYVRSRDPLWDPSLASPPRDFDASSGVGALLSRAPKHWLVLQGPDHIEVLRLDDINFKQVMDAIESRVGIKIDRK
jgi:hypothetical protein